MIIFVDIKMVIVCSSIIWIAVNPYWKTTPKYAGLCTRMPAYNGFRNHTHHSGFLAYIQPPKYMLIFFYRYRILSLPNFINGLSWFEHTLPWFIVFVVYGRSYKVPFEMMQWYYGVWCLGAPEIASLAFKTS